MVTSESAECSLAREPAHRSGHARLPSAHRLLILLLILLTACSARKRIDPSLNALRSVKFEGNGGLLSGHNNLQLTQQMETEDTAFGMLVFPFMYFVEPKLARMRRPIMVKPSRHIIAALAEQLSRKVT